MSKNILVTGGAGYIGSHTVRKLKLEGFNPVIFDNFSSGHKKAVEGFEVIKGDLANKKEIEEALKSSTFEAVLHFAGSIEAGESMADPKRFYANNLVNGINLLNAMVEVGVKKIIFSSSAAIYGDPQKEQIKEDDPKEPTNVYGRTKLMFEQVLQDYDHAYGLKSVSLRYFNAAGADQSGEIGDGHKHKTHLITLMMLTALGQRESLSIFGTDYQTPDGTCIRDYVHVNDLAAAHVLALNNLSASNHSNYFNLGSGRGCSVREAIDMAKKITGVNFNITEVNRREGDPMRLVASSDKARNVLGWSPKYSLEDILETAWKWHNNHPNGYED